MLALIPFGLAGTLSGRVTDDEGGGIAAVTIIAYDERLNYGRATTVADGSWSLEGLPAGAYRVRAMPGETSLYTDRFYPDGWDFCSASVVQVPEEGEVSGIDIVPDLGGALSGVLTDLAGTPLSDAIVYAQGIDSRTALGTRGATTDDDGAFLITGLDSDAGAPTDWQCYVALDGFPGQWLGSSYTDDDAAVYSVTVPAESAGTAVGTEALLDGISVTGLVSGPDGPVADGFTYVYASSQVITAEISTVGVYTADGLPPGDVIAWASVDGLGTTYWPGYDRPTEDRVDGGEEGLEVTGVDLSLPAESVLTVQFSGEGDFGEISALLYNDTHTVGRGGPVADDGILVIDGLWEGDYDLYVYGADGGFLDAYVFEGERVEGETTLTVPLAKGASVSGRLADDAGEGIYGAYVYAYPAEDPDSSYGAVSDQDGYYILSGLPDGYYMLRAMYVHYCPDDRGWVSVYYDAALTEAWASQVDLAVGEAAVDINFALPDDDDHDAMGDAWEREQGLDAERDDAAEDADNDGITNLDEYLLGSDPTGTGSGIGCGCDKAKAVGVAGVLVLLGANVRRRRGAPAL